MYIIEKREKGVDEKIKISARKYLIMVGSGVYAKWQLYSAKNATCLHGILNCISLASLPNIIL